MQRVKSSCIDAIGYDVSSAVLSVLFNTGALYDYYNVPEPIYLEIINARSHGKALAQLIKAEPERYLYKRVSKGVERHAA